MINTATVVRNVKMSAAQMSNWNELVRRDGYHVAIYQNKNNWVVKNPSGETIMSLCPCCDYPFATARSAMLTCDVVHPMEQS